MGRNLRNILILIGVVVLSTAVAFVSIHYVSFLTGAERTIADIRTATLLPPEPQDPRIVIAAVTEDTLRLFPYRSPVDRGFIANLLRTLDERHPAAIMVDVLFDQATEPAKDAELKETIRTLKTPLVIAYTSNPKIVDDKQKAYLDDFVPPALRARAELATDPIDGTVRWIYPGAKNPDGTYTMSEDRAVADRLGIVTPAVPEEIAWHGRPDANTPPFRIFPAHLIRVLPAAWFNDKVVLIGEIVSLTDRHRTPFATVYPGQRGDLPGIVIHAHEISQLIGGRHTRRLPLPAEILFLVLMAALGAGQGFLNLRPTRHMAIGAATLGVMWPVGFAVSYYFGILVPLLEPTIGFTLATWSADVITGRDARRQREFIHSAFARYMNPYLIDQLADDPERLKLGGEARDMTLLFCDVRGFTTISEMFDAQGLTQLINRFLTPMTDIILARHGTIDKYMGDCIMAFWNAPLDDPLHAVHACESALAMNERLGPLNAELEAEAKAANRRHAPIRIGIGLNSGQVVVGNMGSDQRFDYSVLGDNVNLASRLEGQSKSYGVTIVIGENTYERAPDFACLELDLIKVKGKTEAVRIYTLLGTPELAQKSDFQALRTEHDALLAAYRGQNWAAAREHIARCTTIDPGLGLAHLYEIFAERVAEYEQHPPGPDWDGVYVATSK